MSSRHTILGMSTYTAKCGGLRIAVVIDDDAGDMVDDGTGMGMIPGPAEPATVTVEITSTTGGTAPGGNGSVTLVIGGTVD